MKTPLLNAAKAWLSQAKKGECFVFFKGNLQRVCNTAESNMSNAERREYAQACKAAKKAKQPKPKAPDPYARMRPDARALVEFTEAQELRGLVEIRVIVMDRKTKHHEMVCLIQRNGLRGVRAREGVDYGAA